MYTLCTVHSAPCGYADAWWVGARAADGPRLPYYYYCCVAVGRDALCAEHG